MRKTYANPGPVGLVCFGLTTFLLNIHNAGFTEMNSGILAMGIFVGGLTQIIAGVLEYWTGNTFGMTAFISYGLFWEALLGIYMLPKLGLASPPDSISFGIFMLLWFLFTMVMFVGSLRLNGVLAFVLGSLALLFLLLTIEKFTELLIVQYIAGWVGLICATSAMYLGYAELINEAYSKQIFPIFPFN